VERGKLNRIYKTNKSIKRVVQAMKTLVTMLLTFLATAINAQIAGIPASDSLGAEDLYGNPSFIGGVANGGGTAHGVW